jgi:hypothetical protein
MKKVLLLLPALFAIVLLNAQNVAGPNQQPTTDISKVIDFKEVDHDFGKIQQGKPVDFDLYMKNLSSDSVKIQNVQVGCGCTTPKWQPGPYAAGETFKITVGFSGNANGVFSKQITIFFTNGLSKVIHFHGETFQAPANPAPANSAVQQLKPVNN